MPRNKAHAEAHLGPMVLLKRDGLGYQALETARCPLCQARDAVELVKPVLRDLPLWSRQYMRWMSPPAMLALALALLPFPDVRPLGMALYFFGPGVALSNAGMHAHKKLRSLRIHLKVCGPCNQAMQAASRRQNRWRLARNLGSFFLLLLAPGMMTGTHGSMGALWLLASLASALLTVAGWQNERQLAQAMQDQLPAVREVRPDHAVLALPTFWAPALTPPQATADGPGHDKR
jgi:hypothetical protein